MEWLFLLLLTVSLIVLKFTDFQRKNMVFGSLDSQSHIPVKLYTKPCAGQTTTFQLLSAQSYTLQMKGKDGYFKIIFKLTRNQMQLQNSTCKRRQFLNTLKLTFINYKCCYFTHTVNNGIKQSLG